MKQKISLVIIFVGLAGLTLGWFIGFSLGLTQGKSANINTYEECVAAGYPVQESYPEVCSVPGGNSYTNPDAILSVEFEGKVVCMPPKNPDQPHTLECASGLQTDNGEIYLLKDGSIEIATLAGSDQRVQIQGRLQEKDSDKYQSDGELTIESYTILE